MAGTGFTVDPIKLTAAANKIADLNGRYEAEYGKLYATTADLKVSFKGQGSEVFNERIESYRNDFQMLKNTLNEYIRVLNDASKRYTNTDNELSQMATSLPIGK